MLKCSSSISTNDGLAPTMSAEFAVEMKVNEGTSTVFPAPTPNESKAA